MGPCTIPINEGLPQVISELSGHTEPVWSLSWHPSGTLLASCSGDKSVRIWGRENNAASPWNCKSELIGGHKRAVRSVAYAPNGQVLATASFDSTIGIWDRDENGMEVTGWYCIWKQFSKSQKKKKIYYAIRAPC
jgi:WD40 repeat protein